METGVVGVTKTEPSRELVWEPVRLPSSEPRYIVIFALPSPTRALVCFDQNDRDCSADQTKGETRVRRFSTSSSMSQFSGFQLHLIEGLTRECGSPRQAIAVYGLRCACLC